MSGPRSPAWPSTWMACVTSRWRSKGRRRSSGPTRSNAWVKTPIDRPTRPTCEVRRHGPQPSHLLPSSLQPTGRRHRGSASLDDHASQSMTRRAGDGAGLLAAFRAAAENLAAHVEEVNALNVFPVPDGDTGTNMLATVRAALVEAEAVSDPSADRVAQAISFGALMGARGNSGVISSQIFRGMAEGLGGKRHIMGPDLAHALSQGSATAYKAVGKPVEGTILTVIRESAAAALEAAEADGDLEDVLTAAVSGAQRAVARTPSLLPILREAGVVDAGGQGLYRLLQGALQYLVSHTPATASAGAPAGARPSALVVHADEGFGYETMFLLQGNGAPIDIDRLRTELEKMGQSVLVAGDSKAVK